MPTLDDYLNDKQAYPDATTITLADGVETTLGQLRGGYLRDADYRRKTQALADERRRLDEEKAAHDSALTQAREDLAKAAERAARGTSAEDLDEDTQIERLLRKDPAARKLMEKIDKLSAAAEANEKRWQEAREAAQRNQAAQYQRFHEQTLAKLREKDPTLDRDALIDYARENGIARLDIAYRDMMRDKDIERAVKEAREEERAKAQEAAKRTTQPLIPTRRVIPPSLGKDDPKTFEEAAEAAQNDPEIQAIIYGTAG